MSPPSETSPRVPETHSQAQYSPEERKLLLQVAHEAILSSLEGREISESSSPHLSEPRGAFTTLYCQGKLRGCVGYPMPSLPLFRTVIETARAAAFDDPRFIPLSLDEARNLSVSISVLSPLKPILPDQVEIGRHGLLVSDGVRRGLLLPQVPLEHGWDRIAFLEQTCRKAGLPLDAWRTGASIEAFTAEVFGDEELHS
ncbi:MAG TPA: AmmeMemoRadiSam system protein A [Terriglobales bacterium]|nr:AmmeMemoRadiSam system protein A [Terriglobales bacterium]